MKRLPCSWFVIIINLAFFFGVIASCSQNETTQFTITYDTATKSWKAPDTSTIPKTKEGALIRYGRELIVHTAHYLGPKGTIAQISNGMNCQNCHLQAGTVDFANSFAAVSATYPKFRERSGHIESVVFRINECMERSLNGKALDSTSREMNAMLAYFNWLGYGVPTGIKPKGTGIEELPYLDRPADTARGKIIYQAKCQTCHGANGQGLYEADSAAYAYPPLWGPQSYNVSAGMYRLSRIAGFVKNNMPFGANYQKPQLSNEEAWDVSAYVCSQPRPVKLFPYDWPKLATKPVDYPFKPYADSFSEQQHKYGPFAPIKKGQAKK